MMNKIKLPDNWKKILEIASVVVAIVVLILVISKSWAFLVFLSFLASVSLGYYHLTLKNDHMPKESVTMPVESKKIDVDEAYEKELEAIQVARLATREFVYAVKNKRAQTIILEKARAFQVATAELSQALHGLSVQAGLAEEQLEKANVEFSELLAGNLAQEELIAKAEDFVAKWHRKK